MRRPLPLLVMLALAPSSVFAHPPGTVNVDVTGAPLAVALAEVARQANVSLVVDPSVQEVVTVSLHDVPWREALDGLARQGGCLVQERAAGVLVVSRPARLNATFADADVRTALTRLAGPDEGWWVDPRVTSTVSVAVHDATWPEAVRAIAAAAGAKVTTVDGCELVGVDVPDTSERSPRTSLAARFPDSERITAVVTGGDLRPLLAAVASVTSRAATGRPAPGLSATFHDVPWAEAVDVVLQVIGWEAHVDAAGGLRVAPPRLCAQDDALVATRTALKALARPLGLSLVLGAGVAGAQRQAFRALPCELALRLITHGAGLHLSKDGDVLIVDDTALAPAPPSASAGPVFELQAEGADARGWFELLATAGALELEVAPEVQGEVTVWLHKITARRALEVTARVNGLTLVDEGGALKLGGAGRAAPAPEPAPVEDEVPGRESATPATPDAPAISEELSARIEEVLSKAERGQPTAAANEALVAAIDALLARPGGPAAARATLESHERRLQRSDPVRLSLWMKVFEAEAAALLRDMTEAVSQERVADMQRSAVKFGELLSEMQAQGSDAFTTKAQRLRMRATALYQKGERLERLNRMDLQITATAVGPAPADGAALINGAVLRVNDRIPARDGSALELDVFSIENGVVYVRYEGFSIRRPLGR